MALIDVFQLTHNYSAFGEPMANIYHALRENSGETAQDINDAFVNTVMPAIELLWTQAYTSIDLVCFNLGDPEDFHTQSGAGLDGTRVGANEPTFVAAGVRFPSLNRNIRSGHKRFGGMMEADVDNGDLIPATVTLVEDIADDLIGDWLASSDSHHVANYIILKRVCDEVDPVTEECLKYRLPEDLEVPVFYIPTSRVVNSSVTSQVSRKTF